MNDIQGHLLEDILRRRNTALEKAAVGNASCKHIDHIVHDLVSVTLQKLIEAHSVLSTIAVENPAVAAEATVFMGSTHPFVFAYYDKKGSTKARSAEDRRHNPNYYIDQSYQLVPFLASDKDYELVGRQHLALAKSQSHIDEIALVRITGLPAVLSLATGGFPLNNSKLVAFTRHVVAPLLRFDFLFAQRIVPLRTSQESEPTSPEPALMKRVRLMLNRFSLVELRAMCKSLDAGGILTKMRPTWEKTADGYDMRMQYMQHLDAIMAAIKNRADIAKLRKLEFIDSKARTALVALSRSFGGEGGPAGASKVE